MIFDVTQSGNPCFSELHPVLADLFSTLATDPWERYPEGSKRLLPAPGSSEEICLDWEDHVQPGLRHQFDSYRALVAGDLGTMTRTDDTPEGDGVFRLEIPSGHVDAWLTTLNAMRLAIASDHDLGERELAGHGFPDLSTEKGHALMQVNFYAIIQECLLRHIDDGDDEEDWDDPEEGKSGTGA